MRLEGDALFGDFAQGGEGEDLEAAAVGEDGAAPTLEGVEAAETLHDVHPRAKHEVIGVAQDDGGAETLEVLRAKGLDGGLGADGHEDGGVDGPMAGPEAAQAGAALGVFVENLVGSGLGRHGRGLIG